MTTTTFSTEQRPEWDEVWMQVALAVSRRSRCSRALVGAAIVSADGRISATGYNGPAATYPTSGPCSGWCERALGTAAVDNYDACPSIHAETNALLYVDRSRVEGGTVYVTAPPCMSCAKQISNSGLRRVVVLIGEADRHRDPERPLAYLVECGLEVRMIDRDKGEHE